ncbi:MAG: hypothetical protein WBA40_12680, partial [Roseiarcus sp.]
EHYTLQLRPIGQLWPVKKKSPGGSAQPLEKAQNGQGNQRKSKPFPWIDFDPAWPHFAGFG